MADNSDFVRISPYCENGEGAVSLSIDALGVCIDVDISYQGAFDLSAELYYAACEAQENAK